MPQAKSRKDFACGFAHIYKDFVNQLLFHWNGTFFLDENLSSALLNNRIINTNKYTTKFTMAFIIKSHLVVTLLFEPEVVGWIPT